MSYLQDKLKEALGLNKVSDSSSNSFITNWTPNSVRCIIIAKNYILVAKHMGVSVGCVKRVDMDITQVIQDVNEISNKNFGKPKLNITLGKRSFSCLEEIYVDTAYMAYPKVIDLQAYAKEIFGATSRLRYFGYGDFPESGLDSYMNKAYMENRKKLDYALALDSNLPIKLTVGDTKNDKWYSNYLLRPTFYKLDSPKGDLALHFAKIERDYSKQLTMVKKDADNRSFEELITLVAQCDERNVQVFHRVDRMLELLSRNKSDKVCNMMYNEWGRVISTRKPFEGLTQSWVDKIFQDKYMRLVYKRYNVIYSGSKGMDETSLKEVYSMDNGFIGIGSVLSDYCLCVTDKLIKWGMKDMVGLSLSIVGSEIPNGGFRTKYLKDSNGISNLNGYFLYLGDLMGHKL